VPPFPPRGTRGNTFAPHLVLQRGEIWLVYLTTLDYSKNKEAKAVPFVKRQDVVEGRKESPRDWGVWKTRNTKIVNS
jgi:hypothetical protein